jgi:ribosomal protein S18 acetylase RimI-like enzyme
MPHNDPVKDIHRKLSVQPELFLVGVAQGQVIATIMAGYEGHRGWLNYLAVAPKMRRSGLGRQMVLEAEKRLFALGCPKVNLQVRASNREALDFYKKIGYDEDEVVSLGKHLEIDDVSG